MSIRWFRCACGKRVKATGPRQKYCRICAKKAEAKRQNAFSKKDHKRDDHDSIAMAWS
jgi:hypothetical protein